MPQKDGVARMQPIYYEKYKNQFDKHSRAPENDFFKTTVYSSIKTFLPKKGRILDVGCGNGGWLLAFKKNGMQPVGIDLSPSRIETCRALGLEVIQGDLIQNNFEPSSFDVIFAHHFMEHLIRKDRAMALSQFYRWLKPRGIVIIVTPYREDLDNSKVVCPNCVSEFHPVGHEGSFIMGDMSSEIREQRFKVESEFVEMPIPMGSVLPRQLIIFLCKALLKYGYNTNVWEIVTVARK